MHPNPDFGILTNRFKKRLKGLKEAADLAAEPFDWDLSQGLWEAVQLRDIRQATVSPSLLSALNEPTRALSLEEVRASVGAR